MITTEQWLLEVAEQSQLAQTTCQQLWSDLTSLLIGRLTQGDSSYMRSVGLWSAESHSARIALLPSGERYLIPPSVIPRITNQEQPFSVEEIGELLAKGAIQIPQTLQSFYDSVMKLFEMYERLGHTLEWTPLGTFAPQFITGEDESSETSHAFTPSDELFRQVNGPFETFAPTLLKEGVQWPDVEEQPAESLEQACPSVISSRIAESTATLQPTSTPSTWTPQSRAVTPATPTPPPFSANESFLPTAKAITPPPPPISESNEPGAVIATPPPYRRGEPQEREPRKLWFWIVIPLVAIPVMVPLLWFFAFSKQEMPSSRITPSPSMMIPVEVTPTIDIVALIDSAAPVADMTTQQEILTTVILGNDDYLARYAHRYLGRSEYWIYICLANEEQIKDPDDTPLDTEIKIPSSQSVGITGNQETDLATAKCLIHDYYSTAAKN